jgi:DNA-directed RNA polymerase subunit RPC12/RpoP
MLAPLVCGACGAKLPLVAAPTSACPHCRAPYAIPEDYLAAARVRDQHSAARRSLEQQWTALATPPSPIWEWVAAGLTIILPPFATTLVALVSPWPVPMADMTLLVAMPCLLPGGALIVWSIGTKGSTVQYQAALAAGVPERPGGAPTCRNCGGPLNAAAEALTARCGYCGTDSLVRGVALIRTRQRLERSVSTLDDAVRVLRGRRLLLAFGAAAVIVPILVLAVLVWAGMHLVV